MLKRISATGVSYMGNTLCGAMLLVMSGCLQETSSTVTTAPSASSLEDSESKSSPTAPVEPYEKDLGSVVVTVPTGWFEIPPRSGVLLAEFQLPGGEGVGRLTCSAAGGDVEANLDRWRGQFQTAGSDVRPSRSEIEIAGKPAILMELEGTFTDGFATQNAVQENAAMIGIVLPLGEANFFIKATGPQATIKKHRDGILEFARTLRIKP